MIKARLLEKSISTSKKVNLLTDTEALVYTWLIPHTDDFGLLKADVFDIKYSIFPARPYSFDELEKVIAKLIEVKLIKVLTYESQQYYYIVRSKDAQKALRRDIQPQTVLQIKLKEGVRANWEKITQIVDELLITYDKTEKPGENTTLEQDGNDTSQNCTEVYKSDPKHNLTKHNITELNTGIAADERPVLENVKGFSDLKSLLQPKNAIQHEQKNGIYTPWQDKAFRYAHELGIELTTTTKPRWLKVFKDAANGKNPANLERAYSYLHDYSKPLDSQQKMLFFFDIFNNGLKLSGGAT